MGRSVLLAHGAGLRRPVVTRDPIAAVVSICEPQRPLAGEAHEEGDRRDDYEEQKSHHQRVRHLVQRKTQEKPDAVERIKDLRP